MKRFITLIVAVCVVFSLGAVAWADETLSVPILITSEAPVISAKVPASLSASVSSSGVVTTADNAKIENLGTSPIKVSSISITPETGWEVLPSGNFTARNQFRMTINSLAPDSAADSIGVISASSSKDFSYALEIPVQTKALSASKIATVYFTVALDDSIPIGGDEGGSATPVKASGKYIEIDSIQWDVIAKCGDYYLLLSQAIDSINPVAPSLPTGSVVGVDMTTEISVPVADGVAKAFDLSESEFTQYCASNTYVVGVSDEYMLRTANRSAAQSEVYQYCTTSNHRPAIWVQGVTMTDR